MEDSNTNNLTRPTSLVSSASSRPSSIVSNTSTSTSYSYSSSNSALYPLPSPLSRSTTPTSPAFGFPTLENLNINLQATNTQLSTPLSPPTIINPRHALMRSRRISLPANLVHTNYQSLVGVVASSTEGSRNRMSIASVSSFGSLPEEDEELGEGNKSNLRAPPILKRMSSSPPESPTLMRSSLPFPPTSSAMSRSSSYPRPSINNSRRTPSPSGRSSPLSFDRSSLPESLEEAKARKEGKRLERERRKRVKDLGDLDLERLKKDERRWRIALEMRDTERNYVRVLEEIDFLYYQPLLKSAVVIVPLSDLAQRRARKAFSAPTSPNLSPTVLPNRLSVYAPLESIPSLNYNSPPGSPSIPSGPILSRQEIAEIFSNFTDVLGLSRVMLETLEKEVKDKPSNTIPLSIVTKVALSEGLRTPELSSSAETEIDSEGPRTPNDFKLDEEGEDRRIRNNSMGLNFPEKKDKSKRIPSPPKLGKILLPILPFLKSYSLFVSNFSFALSQISGIESGLGIGGEEKKTRWKKFCEERESGIGKSRGLGLGGLLLNVVQRVPRYRFLLGDIIKYTNKDHPDLKDLKKAFDIVDGVATHLESQIQNHANVLQILELQKSFINLDAPLLAPGRILLKSGLVRKLDRRGNDQVRTFFLFNDILIHASGGVEGSTSGWGMVLGEDATSEPMSRSNSSSSKSKSHSGSGVGSGTFVIPIPGSNQYKFHGRFELENVTVVGMDDAKSERKFGFEILTAEKSFAVYAESLEDKLDWIEALRESKANLMRDRRTLQLENRSTLADSTKYFRDRRISLPVSSLNPMTFLGIPMQRTPTPSHSLPTPRLGFTPPSPENIKSPLALRPVSDIDTTLELLSDSSFNLDSTIDDVNILETLPDDLEIEYPVAENYCAPVWVPDSKAERCMRCSDTFSVWRRRHHCRLCGAVVCWACSTNNFIIPSTREELVDDRLARSCDSCWETVFENGSTSTTRAFQSSTSTAEVDNTPIGTPAAVGTPEENGRRLGAVGRLNSLLGR